MTAPESPAYYHLGYIAAEIPVIELNTHPDSLAAISQGGEADRLQDRLGLDTQFVHEDTVWGFGGLASIGQSELVPDWVKVAYKVPDSSELNVEFAYPDNRLLLPLTASIALALSGLNSAIRGDGVHENLPHDETVPQYLVVDLEVRSVQDFYSAMIFAKIMPPMISWLRGNISSSLEREVAESMFSTYSKLTQRPDITADMLDRYFPVALRSPRDLHMDVPGDSTGLDSENRGFGETDESDKEYKLIPHNTDNNTQQLSLLSGIAYLGGKAVRTALSP